MVRRFPRSLRSAPGAPILSRPLRDIASHTMPYHTDVCEKITPPEKKTLWTISLKNTKSGPVRFPAPS